MSADIKSRLPAEAATPASPRSNSPLMRPACCWTLCTGRAEVGVNGPVSSINALAGAVGKSRFNGQASVDFASKPAIKLNLDLQRLDPR